MTFFIYTITPKLSNTDRESISSDIEIAAIATVIPAKHENSPVYLALYRTSAINMRLRHPNECCNCKFSLYVSVVDKNDIAVHKTENACFSQHVAILNLSSHLLYNFC